MLSPPMHRLSDCISEVGRSSLAIAAQKWGSGVPPLKRESVMEDKTKETKEIPEAINFEVLDSEELGIGKDTIDILAASERKKAVANTYTLRMRLDHNRLSMRANQAFGNINAAEQYGKITESIKINLEHAVRVVKKIDKDYPEAKAIMQKMFKGEEKNDTTN